MRDEGPQVMATTLKVIQKLLLTCMFREGPTRRHSKGLIRRLFMVSFISIV